MGSNLLRRVASLTLAIVVIVSAAPSAKADLINGVCLLDVTIEFDFDPTPTDDSPPYTISIDDAVSWCKLDTLQTTLTGGGGTAGSATGTLSSVQCGILAGTGTWDQEFGGLVPPVVDGAHVVTGTWEAATMVVASTAPDLGRFAGVVELLPHPAELDANATKTADCALGGSVSSVRMLGVQAFTDPEV